MAVALRCRGDKKNCPMAIADLVLLYNKAAEALAKSGHVLVGFDFYSVTADSKSAVVQVLQATSWCFIFKWSIITLLGLQVI
jgi:hypothetical protein